MSGHAASEVAFLSRALKAPRLRERAGALAERAREGAWSYEEYLAAVLGEEVAARESHGGEARVKAARFPAVKTLDDFDFAFARSLKREAVLHLAQLDFLAEHMNVIFLGPPGTGKTHLSIALAVQAARRGYRVAFASAQQWVARLAAAKRQGRLDEELERIGRIPPDRRRRGRLHPLRPRGGGAVLRLGELALRTLLDHRELQQDLLGLGGDLRRPGRRRRSGRSPRASRRGARAAR